MSIGMTMSSEPIDLDALEREVNVVPEPRTYAY